MASASALLLAIEALPFRAEASARTPDYALDIPAGGLAEGLSRLSAATGISVGSSGPLPPIRSPALKGRMTVEAALRRLLSGSGWRAVRTGPQAYRLERAATRRDPPARPTFRQQQQQPADIAHMEPPADIVVTAQKRAQSLDMVPLSLSVLAIDPGRTGAAAPAAWDVALATEGLALTNLGAGRNRQFIRGIADTPFNGPSQSTVAVQLDDARITFDAPDPDLRLIDVERVELLKGPQGPLYGSGALGGIYHIVTNRPDPDASTGHVRLVGEAVQHGAIGTGGDAVVNLPLVPGTLAIRGLVYAFQRPGWIDNAGQRRDANMTTIDGGRLALRWRPADGWLVDAGAIMQDINSRDSQYVLSSDDTLSRDSRFAEPSDNDFRSLHLTIDGRIGDVRLLSATSFVDHVVDYTLDATAAAAALKASGILRFDDNRVYRIVNQELRLSPANSERWIAGLSYLHARSRSTGTLSDDSGDTAIIERLDRDVTEMSVFGEAIQPLFRTVEATLGARLSHTANEDESVEGPTRRAVRIGKTILSPSLSLSWRPREASLVYLRYARALRPGGLAPVDQAEEGRFDSDELSTLDLGTRTSFGHGRIAVAASLYYSKWLSVQSDYLLLNGLVSTRNAGDARILGAEASIAWRALDSFEISAGFNLQDARLIRNVDGLELEDRRLPITPDVTARLMLTHRFDLFGWRGSATAQANYIGRARLTFDEDLDRKMGGYALAALGTTLERGRFALTGRIDNLFDIKGDSFAFGNPFSIRNGSQFTPLRPRTLTLSLGYSW